MVVEVHAAPPASPSGRTDADAARQMRRAWQVLTASFMIFTLLASACGAAFVQYRTNATRSRTAIVEQIVAGTQAQIRPRQQVDFRELEIGAEIGEGDAVRTKGDTRLRLRLFDQTAIDLSADTLVSFDTLRASQYLDRNALVVLRMERGRAVITLSPDAVFARETVTVVTPSGTIRVQEPGTSFRVLVFPLQDGASALTNISVLNGAEIVVENAGQHVTIANGQQTVVAQGAVPSAPQIKQRELVENGAFTFAPNALGQPSSHWLREESDGGDGGSVRAQSVLGPELIRGQSATALHISRTGGNIDSDQLGLKQIFALGEVDEFDSVTLRADIKVTSHSLSAGGERGTEYPLIFLLRYQDSKGDTHDVGRGFYTQSDANYRTDNGTLVGIAVKQPGGWEQFSWNLKQLSYAPFKLVSLQVYASGHDYDASVANISIIAK